MRSLGTGMKPLGPAVTDFLCGIAAFVAMKAALLLSGHRQDVRSLAVSIALVSFAASLYRVRRRGVFIAPAVLVGAGCLLPGLIMNRLRMSLTATSFLITFVVAGALATALGPIVGWLLVKHRVLHAITVGSVFLFCLMIVVLSILPRWTTSRSVAVFDREIDPFTSKLYLDRR
jgi:hypothetical protein